MYTCQLVQIRCKLQNFDNFLCNIIVKNMFLTKAAKFFSKLHFNPTSIMKEEFEDTKGIIRNLHLNIQCRIARSS